MALFLLAITVQCDPGVNWNRTLKSNKKGPYGTYILHKEIQALLQSDTLNSINKSVYDYFDDFYDYGNEEYNTSGSYIFVHDYTNNLGVSAAEELLIWASHGNDVFIAAKRFPKTLRDSLGFETKGAFFLPDSLNSSLHLVNPNFKTKTFSMSKGIEPSYFTSLDKENSTVLGEHQIGDSTHVNFIKVKHGTGHFYLHTQPIAFTNYYLLKTPQHEYTENVFSYLSGDNIFWDHNRYSSENSDNDDNDGSLLMPLSYMFGQPALTWAFWLAFFGIILFMIFNAKRRQRIIAIVKPLQNSTISFTKTIGNLYYQEQNHHSIIQKKITYFLEQIRNRYLLETDNLNSEFIDKLQQKTGKKKGEIKLLVNYILKLHKAPQCTEGDLMRLNTLIEKFFKK